MNEESTIDMGLINEDGVTASIITSRRSSNGTHQGQCNANTLQEDAVGGMRGTLKGRELDTMLRTADHRGVYKRFLVLGWLVPACLLVPCAYLNILLMVYLPPANCTLPEPPKHLSHEDWKSYATPKLVSLFLLSIIPTLFIYFRVVILVLVFFILLYSFTTTTTTTTTTFIIAGPPLENSTPVYSTTSPPPSRILDTIPIQTHNTVPGQTTLIST